MWHLKVIEWLTPLENIIRTLKGSVLLGTNLTYSARVHQVIKEAQEADYLQPCSLSEVSTG